MSDDPTNIIPFPVGSVEPRPACTGIVHRDATPHFGRCGMPAVWRVWTRCSVETLCDDCLARNGGARASLVPPQRIRPA